MKLNTEKNTDNQIVIGKSICKNITIVDSDDTPVAVITADELIEARGYRIKFDVGEVM